ncbi:hypothetical protein ABPG72_019449 [Tetrahymena utriculariae]
MYLFLFIKQYQVFKQKFIMILNYVNCLVFLISYNCQFKYVIRLPSSSLINTQNLTWSQIAIFLNFDSFEKIILNFSISQQRSENKLIDQQIIKLVYLNESMNDKSSMLEINKCVKLESQADLQEIFILSFFFNQIKMFLLEEEREKSKIGSYQLFSQIDSQIRI